VFGAVALARRVGLAGSTFPAVYNAANEVAVEAFNSGRIGFLDIVDTIERVVDAHEAPAAVSLESVLAADAWARSAASSLLPS
jgi:1-deoxy-D-xylulose-5-phosphate reductoisomerase